MAAFSQTVHQLVRAYLRNDIGLSTYLREDPQDAKKVYAHLHMAFNNELGISRVQRILFLRELFGRSDINSFGDITFAEARALMSFRDELKELYGRVV